MTVTITSPAEGAVVELTPNAEGRLTVTVTGSSTTSYSSTTNVEITTGVDAEPEGWFWRSPRLTVPGDNWTAVFEDVPYASEYSVYANRAGAGDAEANFSIRRPVQFLIPDAPGAEVPIDGATGSLAVRGLLGANAGDTIGAAIPRPLREYASSPPEQFTGEFQPIRSDWFGVKEEVTYLLEVWLKADRPGSRLTIEWADERHGFTTGFGTTSPTGVPGDITPGAPGTYVVNDLELPTEWTRYRANVTWTFAPGWAVPEDLAAPGRFHFNLSSGSEQNAVQSIGGLRMVPYPEFEKPNGIPEGLEFPGHPDAWFYLGTNRIPYAGDWVSLFPVEMETLNDNPPPGSGSWSSGSRTLPTTTSGGVRLPHQGFPFVHVTAPGAYTLYAWIQPDDPNEEILVASRNFTTEQAGFDEPPATPEVKVLRGSGFFQGGPADIAGFSVSEDAVPTNLVDLSGGISSMTFDVISNDDTEMLMHRPVSLADPNYGVILGEVTGVEMGENGVASVTADSALRRLVRSTIIEPTSFEDLSGYLHLLLEESGFEASEIDIVLAPTEWESLYPGGERDLWTWMKELLALHNLEIVMVGTRVRIRSRQSITIGRSVLPASISDEGGLRRSITEGDAAREVSVTFYEPRQQGRWTVNPPEVTATGQVYPALEWNEDTQILQVDASETLEETLDINASIFSVEQPQCVIWVARDETSSGVYSVSGNDGLPIVPQQWLDAGGALSVRRSDDTRSLIVTLTGADLPDLAPFQIAMSAGPSDRYSSLRVRGTGVVLTEKTLSIPTGVSDNLVFTETAPNIDSEMVTNLEEAYTAAVASAKWHSGSVMEISGFEADLWRWRLYESPIEGGLNLQSFGNMAGSRFRTGRRVWRVQSVDTTPEGSQFTAREDTSFWEFQDGLGMYLNQGEGSAGAPYTSEPNGGWKQQSFEDFNAEYAGMTFADFTTRPLRRDDVPTPPELTNEWENYVLNPSFEQSLVNWTAHNGASISRVRLRDWPNFADEFPGTGDYAALVRPAPDEGRFFIVSTAEADVSEGQWVGVRATVAASEFPGELDVYLSGFRDGVAVRSVRIPVDPLDAEEVREVEVAWRVDGGVLGVPSSVRLEFRFTTPDGTPAVFLLDGAMLVVADTAEEALRRVATYVDGDTPDDYERISFWRGGSRPSARENNTTIVRDLGE